MTDPIKQPLRPAPGSKLENSSHRDHVATMLLIRKGYSTILRWLDSQDSHVDISTLKEFETNYVSKLDQQVRDRLIQLALTEENQRNQMIINKSVHARMSRVESLMLLIAKVEAQVEELESKDNLSPFDRDTHGRCLDRIRYYREQLEKARIESEVEIARVKAIEQVATIALEFLKDKPDAAERFIKRAAAVREHRDPTSI